MEDPATVLSAVSERYGKWLDKPESAAWHACKRIAAHALIIRGGLSEAEALGYRQPSVGAGVRLQRLLGRTWKTLPRPCWPNPCAPAPQSCGLDVCWRGRPTTSPPTRVRSGSFPRHWPPLTPREAPADALDKVYAAEVVKGRTR